MKKTIGICFFAGGLLLCVLGLFFLLKPEKEELPSEVIMAEETEELPEAAESMTVQEPYAYMIQAKDGVLVVYEQDGKTVYFETAIRLDALEETVQEKVIAGMRFYDERELYGFLESYSS